MIILILLLMALLSFAFFFLGKTMGYKLALTDWKKREKRARVEAVKQSRAVLSGQFSEQLSPFLPGFKYLPTECRFIGRPVDFIVFRGIDEKDIKEVVFLEVKSGSSGLSAQEKNLMKTINAGRVRWEEYRVPDDLTKR